MKLLSNLSFEKLAKSIIKPRPDRAAPATVNTAVFELDVELLKADIEPKVATVAPNIDIHLAVSCSFWTCQVYIEYKQSYPLRD